MFSVIIDKINSIGLKWKILIPFLCFAFAGNFILSYIGLSSQQRLIKQEEKAGMMHFYQLFLEEVNNKGKEALSLATMVAENSEVQTLLAERDRQALNVLLVQTYVQMKLEFDIEQFHFHIPPAISFLRLHHPERFGEDLSVYRKTIREAMKTCVGVSGLEKGEEGFGMRGVSPVFYGMELVGTVEIGHSFGKAFLKSFHRRWGTNLALYEIGEDNSYQLLAKAGAKFKEVLIGRKEAVVLDRPTILILPEDYPDRSILSGPVKDYSGNVVALVEMNFDRSETRERLSQTRNLMVLVGLIAVAVSFLLTFLVASLLTKPIKEIAKQAQDIAQERRESRLEPRPMDEIGILTQALNVMLHSLKQRRLEIEGHAKTLEGRVQERTAALLASEEKYRTLVENVPLIVYRVLEDGTTEFINSYLTESLGYTIEEAVRDKNFWREKICGEDLEDHKDIFRVCFQDGEECRVEREVSHKDGRLLTFIDHAMPARDEEGRIRWIEGIMIDISQLKELQERALRTEEIRILGEISARVAHEIRNPLVTAGGFSRRLRDSLPEKDPHRRLAQVIVGEVARMESFLKILLSSIRPFELSVTEVDLNDLLRSGVKKLDNQLKSKDIRVVEELSPSVPLIKGDEDKLDQAFESLLKHAIVSTPKGEILLLSTTQMDDTLVVTLRHKLSHLSDEDLEQFFFPHVEEEPESTVLDLPLSKIIIHRHGGKVELNPEEGNILTMRIEFPLKRALNSGG
ncbi:MAG: cache domain-containing protein [Desulfobacteraceae bacterium]|jgi:PAS domain S-box-containing protein